MKTLTALAAIAALSLTGCGADPHTQAADTGGGHISEYHPRLEDGRTVTCLVYASGYKGGLDCDWDSAR